VRQELDRLAEIARQAVRSGRAIAHGLAPLDESEGDLIEALRRMTQHHLAEVSAPKWCLRNIWVLSLQYRQPRAVTCTASHRKPEQRNPSCEVQAVTMELVVTPAWYV